MSGVVFMVCVPSEAKEYHLCSVRKKKFRRGENEIEVESEENSPNAIYIENRDKKFGSNKFNVDSFETEHVPMIRILEDILITFSISNAVWYRGEGDYVQVVFPLESQEQCEAMLYRLNSNNIGKLYDSTVSVLPCSVHYNGHGDHNRAETSKAEVCATVSDGNTWTKIVSSKNTRLTVDQIVETVKARATLTFDFVCLIIISTIMCALGLVENSTVYLLSSMVMSPMMGPVMAATFGSVIRDSRLKKIGVQNELLGLFIATVVGFFYGSIVCMITDKYGDQEWPTYEITSRGELRSLWIGCIIALLSGAAVALGILSDNIASLVGVAISTSLMPPAVNAGLLWSMASAYYLKGNSSSRYSSLQYQKHYSESDSIELLTLGAVSICLTLVNIVCIYFSAICIFKIKEVAPIASRDKERRKFWKYDIKNARNYNTIQQEEGEKLKGELKQKSNFRPSTLHEVLHQSIDFGRQDPKILIGRQESTWSHSVIGRLNLNEFFPQRDELRSNSRWSQNTINTRRLSSIFKEGVLENSNNEVLPNELEPTTPIGQNERDAKLIFTKSRTFTVVPCEGTSQTLGFPAEQHM